MLEMMIGASAIVQAGKVSRLWSAAAAF
jgi:hypothetical protein